MKYMHKGKPICELIGVKSRMRCIRSNDAKESNTAKGVNIEIGFI